MFCDQPLSSDTKIELLDKDDQIVGKINVARNDKDFILPIQFVKVMGDEPDNRYNQQTFGELNEAKFNSIKKDLAEKYFNQSLIKLDVQPVKEMIVNTERLIDKKLLIPKYRADGSTGIPNYKKGFDDELHKIYTSKWGDFKGIIVFLSAMQQPGTELGHAKIFPRKSNYNIIVPDSVTNVLTITHEIAHSLGLFHPSTPIEINGKYIISKNRWISQINDYLKQNEKTPNNAKLKGKEVSFGDYKKELLKEKEEKINEINEISEHKPKYIFNLATTENIMDYNGYKIGETVINNPKGNGITFWQWQTKIMLEELKLYHGK